LATKKTTEHGLTLSHNLQPVMESTIMRQYAFVLGHPCDLMLILLSDDPISRQPVLGCHNLLEGCGKLSHSRRIGALVISIGMVMSILYNHPAPGTSATTLCHVLSGMPVDVGEAPLSSTLMVLLDPYQVLGCVVRVVCSYGGRSVINQKESSRSS
jgi:hypothetical protein